VQPITRELIVEAVALRRRYQVSHWDATILAAARAQGCHTLYTEDLNHGQDYEGVRVVNPFMGDQ
jgi:predicted nucleic acid-binding protein